MEHQVIEIDDSDGEENKTAKSQPNGASSSQVESIYKKQASSNPLSSPAREARESQQLEESALADKKNDEITERDKRPDDDFEYSLNLIRRQLEQRSQLVRKERSSSSKCIFKLPDNLVGIDNKAAYPEMVSIGPYHRGKDHLLNFEDHKWFFLQRVLSRTSARPQRKRDLSVYIQIMRELEQSTRRCYSDDIVMDSHNFTEMMLLDGFFVIELFLHLGSKDDVDHMSAEENHPIFFSRPWLIPILLRDLLKLENQLPFDVLKSLFYISSREESANPYELEILALQVFDLAFPWPLDITSWTWNNEKEIKHLLHLVYLSLRPRNFVTDPEDLYRPSITSKQSVTLLRKSGIKFKAKKVDSHKTKKVDRTKKVDSFLNIDLINRVLEIPPITTLLRKSGLKFKAKKVDSHRTKKVDSFLNIDLKNRVLEIPPITVNDFTSTLLLNCIAWEHCDEDNFIRYFTDYVLFMNCLVKTPRDVAFLCLDGTIATFSQDDMYVANLFSSLAKSVAFVAHVCYVSKQFRDLEAYSNSYWATMMRTYFSSPWSVISVSSAALIIALTMIQTLMAVLSYLKGTPTRGAT